MSRVHLVLAVGVLISAGAGFGEDAASTGPYKLMKTSKVGGEGGFDYVYSDDAGRRLYVARTGPAARISIFDLDTLEPVGEIAKVSAHGTAVDAKSHHGFGSSKPVVMWDSKTLATIKTIDVEGAPDGLLSDAFNQRVYIFSHRAPNATVIDAVDGKVLGTIDLGDAPEQAVSDGKGHIYVDIEVDIEDKANVAVIDAKTMAVTAHYDLGETGGTPAGLAMDVRNDVLFVACRTPAPGTMVMLNAKTGKVIASLPLAGASDGAAFNPKTMEAFSSAGNGTLSIVKENSPASFVVEQTLSTMQSAKTLTLDTKTGRVLLIGAEFGAPTAPATAGGRPGRGAMVPDSFSILVAGK